MKSIYLISCFLLPVLVYSKIVREKRQIEKCTCVDYQECQSGYLDPSKLAKLHEMTFVYHKWECTGLDICCKIPDTYENGSSSSTIKPNVAAQTPRRGSSCGIQNHESLFLINNTKKKILSDNLKSETMQGEFPWMIALLNETVIGVKMFLCGASLITPNVVLTSANCVRRIKMNDLVVRAGEWDARKNESIPHQDRKVSKKIMHEGFNSATLMNDIALLFLNTPFTLSDSIDTICITKENAFQPKNCQATGWGINNYTYKGLYQPILKKVYLPLVDHDTCQSELRKTRLGEKFHLHQSFICAGGIVNQDTCIGDGGGPLVCAGYEGDRFAQLGIVSWGIGCGGKVPGVYTSVSHFHDWINKQLATFDFN